MKNKGFIFMSVCILNLLSVAYPLIAQDKAVELPFSKGVNLSEGLGAWNINQYDKTDIDNLKSIGVDVIRLPLYLESFCVKDTNHQLDTILYVYLDTLVDACEADEIYCIIDNHSYTSDKVYPDRKIIDEHLQSVWAQLAAHYKDRSKYVMYEILNEPHNISYNDWNKIQLNALNTIRIYDTTHIVVLCGAEYSNAKDLRTIQFNTDPNVICTFHFYSPFHFTHQGADWTSPEVKDLSAIPFPYDKRRIYSLPKEIRDTPIGNYLQTGFAKMDTEEALREEMKLAVSFRDRKHIPVFCGEMGSYDKTALEEDRIRWFKAVGSLFAEYHIPFCEWGYGGGGSEGFGLCYKNTGNIFPYDLDPDILKALGFFVPDDTGKKAPVQNSAIAVPTDFYCDGVPKNVLPNYWAAGGFINLFLKDEQNRYCVQMRNCKQFSCVTFSFKRNMDFSQALAQNAAVSFEIKTTVSNLALDVRLEDKDTEQTLPWRMSYRIETVPADNEWHTVTIPLSELKDTGAWSNIRNSWSGGKGEFIWTEVYQLVFIAEKAGFVGDVNIREVRLLKTE